MDWPEIRASIDSIQTLCRVIAPIDVDLHIEGVRLAERYGFSFYDALMIASALRLNCETFWSENMQHSMVVDGRMTIKNPFR
jgi:predicted nucleic acid-binding protein